MTDVQLPTIRQAKVQDWPAVHELLAEAGLPVADLDAGMLDAFLIAEDGPDIVGLVGLQGAGTSGLLRSLIVSKSARDLGIGGRLVTALESASAAAGVTELWLLTIDAEKFFARHGFQIVNREMAPSTIQNTKEFSDLCPGTAFLMRKKLN